MILVQATYQNGFSVVTNNKRSVLIMFSKMPGSKILTGFILMIAVNYASVAETKVSSGATEKSAVIQIIREEARKMGVSVPLALAVAHAESHFNPNAESHKGARGVMQVMPATSRSEYGIHPDLLWDVRINIRLGLHFMRRLLSRYQGRVDLALSYYNGGSRVGNLPNARVIPATRKYVQKVLRLRRYYRSKMYAGELSRWNRITFLKSLKH